MRLSIDFEVETRDFLKIPNLITVSGIAATVFYVYSYLIGNVTLLFVMLAWVVVSDLLDGVSARRLHQETALGSLLDPIRDRLFILAVLGNMVWLDGFDAGFWAGFLIVSEVFVGGVGTIFFLAKGKRISVNSVGRTRQMGHILLAGSWLLGYYLAPNIGRLPLRVVIQTMALLSFTAFGFYFGRAWTMWHES